MRSTALLALDWGESKILIASPEELGGPEVVTCVLPDFAFLKHRTLLKHSSERPLLWHFHVSLLLSGSGSVNQNRKGQVPSGARLAALAWGPPAAWLVGAQRGPLLSIFFAGSFQSGVHRACCWCQGRICLSDSCCRVAPMCSGAPHLSAAAPGPGGPGSWSWANLSRV